jgi:Protein of unknown function (DUF3443)
MGTLRNWLIPVLFAAQTLIQGCGGGGGSSSSTSTTGTIPVVIAGSNAQPISVDAGLGGSANLPFTSVTLCAPGDSTNCQTIDHLIVDTGSIGLRIMSSALAASLSLTQQTDAGGNSVAECAHFADGNTWGPVKLADLKIAGEQASRLPIQVIGDSGFTVVPVACSSTGPLKDTVQAFGANGILGLGAFRQDCGNACAQSSNPGIYFTCPAAGCQPAAIPLTLQLQHPATMFAGDKNGVIIELPSVPAAGAASVSGSLVFGIGTRANNAFGAANVINLNPSTGNFTTNFNGASYPRSFVDSGSNALFFQDAAIPVCQPGTAAPGFYCPALTFNGSAAIPLANGTSATVNFSVANAATLVRNNPGFAAFGNLGGPQVGPGSFDWGLPFFYGRKVYTAIEGAVTPGGPTGPYVAF